VHLTWDALLALSGRGALPNHYNQPKGDPPPRETLCKPVEKLHSFANCRLERQATISEAQRTTPVSANRSDPGGIHLFRRPVKKISLK
jgi:hypothetical protein